MSSTTDARVALVTGGSRGIGAATAKRLAADGFRVAVTYAASPERAEQVVSDVKAAGGEALAIRADQGDAAETRAAVQRTVDTFGRLDVVVANAGVYLGAPLAEADLEVFDRQMGVNVRGVFVLAQAALEHLGEGGRFLVTGSVNADAAFAPGATMYATSKAAVQGMVRGLAHDLAAKGATANVVQPGPIDTEMNPDGSEFSSVMRQMTALGRYGRAEEVADVFAFLASPAASYVTGATINVDGAISV